MIFYVEQNLLFDDDQCREVNLCEQRISNGEEFLLSSTSNRCSCRKRTAIFCKCERDTCLTRAENEKKSFLQFDPRSKNVLLNHRPLHVVLLEKNQFEENAEIISIAHQENLPTLFIEHCRTDANSMENDEIQWHYSIDYLAKHSLFVENLLLIYSIFQRTRRTSSRLKFLSSLGYLLTNVLLGIVCSLIVSNYFDYDHFVSDEILGFSQNFTERIRSIIGWLMQAPAGLKLNQPLVEFLARFYFYHIYLWSDYLEAVVITILPYFYRSLIILSFVGISLAIGAICDFFRLLTIHLYCFYIYSARLFNWQVHLLIVLFRLFCGKKQNPLRNFRLDSHLCDLDQLFIVTLSFTILLFLLPSIFMYYAVFTSIWIITAFIVKTMETITFCLSEIPIYEFYLLIVRSKRIRGT